MYDDDEIVPIQTVLKDMKSRCAILAQVAQCYYYDHYATKAERKEIDHRPDRYIGYALFATAVVIVLSILL